MIKHKSILFFPAILLFFFYVVKCPDAATTVNRASDTHLSIDIESDLFSMDADIVPLSSILNELSRKAGIRFTVNDDSLSTRLISVSFKGLPFSEALERVLRDYSYIVTFFEYPHVIVLSSKGSQGSTGGKGNAMVFVAGSPENMIYKGSLQTHNLPQTLDECRKPDFTEKEAKQNKVYLFQRSENENTSYDRLLSEQMEADRRAIENAKIKRAREVLGMEQCSHLWEEAINELIDIQDGRVTSLLTDIARNGRTLAIKTKATEALWLNTAKSEFKNLEGINALRNLSSSSEEGVSYYAKQALQDYERYMNRTRYGVYESGQDRK